jgi:flagellar motor switch protein FliN/FliY
MAEQDVKNDLSADDWAAAMAEQGPGEPARDHNVGALAVAEPKKPVFKELSATPGAAPPANLEMVMDIPVHMTVELGRTKIQIRNLLQLAQGSVIELDRLAGEPMDVLVNGCLVAQGEVVVVNDKFGIRLTDVIAPEERLRRLNR